MSALWVVALVVTVWLLSRLCARWNEAERIDIAVRAAIRERDRMHRALAEIPPRAYAQRLEDLMTDTHPEAVTN